MMLSTKLKGRFLATLAGAAEGAPPIWLMRQAGRYLPEYRAIRAKAATFLDFCSTPDLAVEATLQPIRRFGFDAAILFSDILVVPHALGQPVSFETGEGPRLKPIETPGDFAALSETLDPARIDPALETLARVRAELSAEVALIGFCGAPWTVASYMIAGRGTPEQAPARLFAYRHRPLFEALIARLVDVSADYLVRQLRAGARCRADLRQLGGRAGAGRIRALELKAIAAMAGKIRAAVPDAPIIAFPRGAGARLGQFADVDGLAAIGLDTAMEPEWAKSVLPARLALQGNLDPIALLAGGDALDAGVDRILDALQGRPHIFNLGHGILPETPIAHVERLVERVRARGG